LPNISWDNALRWGVPSVGPLGTTLGEAYFGNGLIPKHHPTLDD